MPTQQLSAYEHACGLISTTCTSRGSCIPQCLCWHTSGMATVALQLLSEDAGWADNDGGTGPPTRRRRPRGSCGGGGGRCRTLLGACPGVR